VSTIPVWVLVVVGAVLVGTIAPPTGYLRWLAIVLAGALIATFIIQLALPNKEGLVNRMILSIGGAVVLLAIATAVLLPLSA
jgi:hypothetical protein